MLTTLLFLGSSAVTQTADSQSPNALPAQVAVARCAYTQAEGDCASQDISGSGGPMLAQIPRGTPGPPFRGGRPPMRRPGYADQGMGRPEPSGRHALIGAVIGGLLGWAVAAKGTAGTRATLGIATIGAGIGAGIGLSIPAFPSGSRYRGRWSDEDEDAMRSRLDRSKSDKNKTVASGRLAPAPHFSRPKPSKLPHFNGRQEPSDPACASQ